MNIHFLTNVFISFGRVSELSQYLPEFKIYSFSLITKFRSYVANRVSDKLTKITDHIYCCRSGSAADTQAIADIVNYHLGFHEYTINTNISIRV